MDAHPQPRSQKLDETDSARFDGPEADRQDPDEPRRDESADPDDDVKPDSLRDLRRESWKYVARRTVREFSKDQCTDLAAALVYYSVLAIFPAAIALLSVVGLVGQA